MSQTDGGREENSGRAFASGEAFAEFVANNFYYLLVGRKLEQNFRAQRFFANVLDEFVSYADVDVAFQQSFANFHQGRIEMLFGEFALAAQILERALEFVCESFKHVLRTRDL